MQHRWRQFRGGAAALILLALSAAPSAQNGWQFRDWKTGALSGATSVQTRGVCASLIALTGYEFSITTATTVAAGSDWPEYCRVVGLIQPELRFEVTLPAAWNGRLYMFGNGGYAGEALDN